MPEPPPEWFIEVHPYLVLWPQGQFWFSNYRLAKETAEVKRGWVYMRGLKLWPTA